MENFYQQNKSVVWVIQIEDGKTMGNMYGSGFSVGNKMIVTCAHLFNDKMLSFIIRARRLDEDNFTHEMEIKYMKPSWDMVMLKFKNDSVQCEIRNISDDGILEVGEEVYCIGNPKDFVGSFMISKAGYPCKAGILASAFDNSGSCAKYPCKALQVTPSYRVMGDVWNTISLGELPAGTGKKEQELNPLIPIIQCVGMVYENGCSGGPVFRANGDIIGMLAMDSLGYGIAIHSSALKEFILKSIENDKAADTFENKERVMEANIVGVSASTPDTNTMESFYNRHKGVVWVIELQYIVKRSTLFTYGSGFSFSDHQIITCAHLFKGKRIAKISARRLEEIKFTLEMMIEFSNPTLDITLLKPKEESTPFEFVQLAKNGNLDSGEKLYHIGHPNDFVGTFSTGYVVYGCVDEVDPSIFSNIVTCVDYDPKILCVTPPCRVMGNVWNKNVFRESDTCLNRNPKALKGTSQYRVMGNIWNKNTLSPSPYLTVYEKRLNSAVQIIQCRGLHANPGCSGGPVFKTSGELVGMIVLGSGGYDIAVHLSTLKAFLDEASKSTLKASPDEASNDEPNAKRLRSSTAL